MSGGLVSAVLPDSIASLLGIRPGDVLLEVNGHAVRDVLDVQFYAADEELDLTIRRGDHEILYEIERDYDAPLGLDFASPTFDDMRRCDNHCEFCFVAQMPRGLRRSLYVRDDDYRYSVLYGSFVTLTNLTAEDWDRFTEQRLSPLYVSVHATDPAVRQRMLGREGLPDILEQIDRLTALGIEIHTQVVLTPGVNDGERLSRTVADLGERHPGVGSIGIVPVGLTRYHRGGCRRYTDKEAAEVIEQVVPLQQACRAEHGASVVYLADEWYLLAGADVPTDEDYDDYPQIENGIGLVRQFLDDASDLYATVRDLNKGRGIRASPRQVAHCTLVCGTLVAPIMAQVARELAGRSGVRIDVVPVPNRLFGETVTVSGLLAGEDVLAALAGRDLGEVVFTPQAMFADYTPDRDGAGEGQYTLDELSLRDLQARLGRRVVAANWMSELWDVIAGRDSG